MDALVFDFDGVIVNSEPIHLQAYQQVLGPLGIELGEQEYYRRYLGFSDRDCFAALFADRGRGRAADAEIDALIAAKTQHILRTFATTVQPLPGARELIHAAAAAAVPVAICSGGLRDEIEQAASTIGVASCIGQIVAAEDVRRGKPDPEGYRLTLERLSLAAGRPMQAERCVVVEDAPPGIEAAKAVGYRVLAVTNSYGRDALRAADRIVSTLDDVTLADLEVMTG